MSKSKKSDHKTLCEYSKKEVELQLDKIAALVMNPGFICSKCARAANMKQVLCHPQKL